MRHLKLKLPKLSRKTLIIAGTVLFVCGASITAFAFTRPPKVAYQAPTSQTKPVEKAADKKVSEQAQQPVASTEQPVPETPPVSTTPNSNSNGTRFPGQLPTPPMHGPFAINSISLYDKQLFCSNGYLVMNLPTATVYAGSILGGTYSWQLEVTGAWPEETPAIYSRSVTIPANQNVSTISVNYSTGYAKDGQAVRIHVTSPNDVASPWFTVPAGTYASCTNS